MFAVVHVWPKKEPPNGYRPRPSSGRTGGHYASSGDWLQARTNTGEYNAMKGEDSSKHGPNRWPATDKEATMYIPNARPVCEDATRQACPQRAHPSWRAPWRKLHGADQPAHAAADAASQPTLAIAASGRARRGCPRPQRGGEQPPWREELERCA
eukprot:6203854-Pleurochrysis_carterae.AAC.2